MVFVLFTVLFTMYSSIIHELRYEYSHKIENYIQHRQFKEFLIELSSEFGNIVYFIFVRWLIVENFKKDFFTERNLYDQEITSYP